MADLVRKSFYIDQGQARRLAEHIFRTYLSTGHRITESEVVREALRRYLDAESQMPQATGDAGEERER